MAITVIHKCSVIYVNIFFFLDTCTCWPFHSCKTACLKNTIQILYGRYNIHSLDNYMCLIFNICVYVYFNFISIFKFSDKYNLPYRTSKGILMGNMLVTLPFIIYSMYTVHCDCVPTSMSPGQQEARLSNNMTHMCNSFQRVTINWWKTMLVPRTNSQSLSPRCPALYSGPMFANKGLNTCVHEKTDI